MVEVCQLLGLARYERKLKKAQNVSGRFQILCALPFLKYSRWRFSAYALDRCIAAANNTSSQLNATRHCTIDKTRLKKKRTQSISAQRRRNVVLLVCPTDHQGVANWTLENNACTRQKINSGQHHDDLDAFAEAALPERVRCQIAILATA